MKYQLNFLFLFIYVVAVGQTVERDFQMINAQNSSSVGFFKTLPPAASGVKAEYYLNDHWKTATFELAGDQNKEKYRVQAKVNVFQEQIEIKLENKNHVIDLKRLRDFTLHEEYGDRSLLASGIDGLQDPGIYEMIYIDEEDKAMILKRYYCKTYPPNYVVTFDVGERDEIIKVEEELLFQKEDKYFNVPNSRKKFCKLFDHPKRIRKIIKESKLDHQDPDDLMTILAYSMATKETMSNQSSMK